MKKISALFLMVLTTLTMISYAKGPPSKHKKKKKGFLNFHIAALKDKNVVENDENNQS